MSSYKGLDYEKMCIALMGMLLLSLAGPAMAAADEKEISKLRVEGEGKVRVAPDMATIVLGVESRSTKAAEAVEENARLMNQTINALIEAGISESQMQTSRFSLTTVPQDEKLGADAIEQPLVFLATNQVTVKLDKTEDVGRVLDAAVGAGSNSIQEVRFDLKDPAPRMMRPWLWPSRMGRERPRLPPALPNWSWAGFWS